MGAHVSQNTILVVEPDASLRTDILRACTLETYSLVELESEDMALDWLWERGKEAAVVFIQQTESTISDPNSLINVLARDWPDVRVIVGESHRGALATSSSGLDYLPYPWTPWQVAQKLMTVSAQRAA